MMYRQAQNVIQYTVGTSYARIFHVTTVYNGIFPRAGLSRCECGVEIKVRDNIIVYNIIVNKYNNIIVNKVRCTNTH